MCGEGRLMRSASIGRMCQKKKYANSFDVCYGGREQKRRVCDRHGWRTGKE